MYYIDSENELNFNEGTDYLTNSKRYMMFLYLQELEFSGLCAEGTAEQFISEE